MEKQKYYGKLEYLGIIKRIPCGKDEIKILKLMNPEDVPDDICVFEVSGAPTQYCRYPEISREEVQEQIAFLNAWNIKTIKNCAVFFTVLTAIGLATALIAMFI